MTLYFNCNKTYKIAKNFSKFMKLIQFKRMVSEFFSLSYVQIMLEFNGNILDYLENIKQLNQMPVSELGFYDGMQIGVIDKAVYE